MPNTYFSFKQFTIQQQDAAMKVCTDACLFGAWLAARYGGASDVLDIGTGTGLLSLLYAQKNDCSRIDAVEIDPFAATQAAENFQNSPWGDRLKVHQDSIQMFTSDKRYDLIITNPPFFENDLVSVNEKRNLAMHSSSLTLEELVNIVRRLLLPGGKLAILLPYSRGAYFTGLMEKSGFYLIAVWSVRQSPVHPDFRAMLVFSPCREACAKGTIIIKDDDNNYTPEFTNLLKEYYLYL